MNHPSDDFLRSFAEIHVITGGIIFVSPRKLSHQRSDINAPVLACFVFPDPFFVPLFFVSENVINRVLCRNRCCCQSSNFSTPKLCPLHSASERIVDDRPLCPARCGLDYLGIKPLSFHRDWFLPGNSRSLTANHRKSVRQERHTSECRQGPIWSKPEAGKVFSRCRTHPKFSLPFLPTESIVHQRSNVFLHGFGGNIRRRILQ